MHNSLKICLFTLLVFFHAEVLRAAEPLRFVCWNLEWFPGKRPTASEKEAKDHMKEAQAALKKLNPDIFVAVEIRDWAALHELVSVVPGLTVNAVSSFYDTTTGKLGPLQIGIASKLTCRGAWWENWQATLPAISRGFTFAVLEAPQGGLLMIYGVHLQSNRGSDHPEGAKNVADMRNDQTRQLLEHRKKIEVTFAEQGILGWIACGDMNTNHDNQFPLCNVVKLMTDGGLYNTWANTPKQKRRTWLPPDGSPFEATTFDYIFTSGLKKNEAVVIDASRKISDHTPIGLLIEKP